MAIRRLMMMGLTNYIRSLIKTFETKVNSNQGQFEAEDCIYSTLDHLNKINLLESAYTILTPNSFFESEVAGLYPTITNTPIVNKLSYTNIFYTLWSYSFTTSTRVSVANPFGGTYSNQFTETASVGTHIISQPFSVISGVTYTYSIYLKKGVGATSPDIMQLTFGTNGFNTTLYANFNISLGTNTASSGVTASISDAGNGWWRCSITTTAATTNINGAVVTGFTNNNPSATRSVTYTGATTTSTYIYGAQLEIGSSVTSYQEIDILSPNVNNYASFIKGSSLYNFRSISNGLLETLPWNLSSYTEDISYWTLGAVTTTPYTINSPTGTLSATRVVETVANASHVVSPTTISLREIIPVTCSIYMKKGIGTSAPDWMQITLANTAVAGTQRANFNINTGTIGTFSVGTNPNITDAGNGWWLCQATFVPQVITSATNIQVAFINNSSTAARIVSYTGNVNSDVYLWGAQMVEGSVTYPYLPTTTRQNFPKINYYDSSPNIINSCPNFLLETSTTNLFLNSEVFSSVWVTSNMTVTPDQEPSPHPEYNGDTLTATSNDAYITQSAGSTSANSARVFSVWLKRKTGTGEVILQSGDASSSVTINSSTWTRCWIYNNSMPGSYSSVGTAYTITTTSPHGLITGDAIRFIRSTGTATTQNILTITVTSTTQFTFTGTSVTTSGNCDIISNSGRIILSTNGDEVYAWGAQLELIIANVLSNSNVIPTTYISTPNSTVTRSADTMIANNPVTTQATFYAKLKRLGGSNNNAAPFIAFSDSPTVSTSQNSIHCSGVSGGLMTWYYRAAGGTVTTLSTSTIYSPNEANYFDIVVTVDNSATYKFNIWMDGSLIVSSTASIDTSLKYAVFGSTQPIMNLKEYVSWDRVLTNDEIISLFAYPYYNAGYNPTNVELQHVINRAYAEGFTLPSTSILGYCDTLITEMKNDGVWSLSDVYFNFAYNDISLTDFARINWKNPYGALGLATVFGTITLTTEGFSNDGTTGNYINTNFNSANIQTNYTLNNAGRMFVIASDLTFITSRYYDSANTSANRMLRATTSSIFINASVVTGGSINTAGIGLKSLMRDDSTNIRFQNGSTVYNRTSTSTSVSNTTQVIGNQNGSGSADAVYANYWMGGSLNDTQINNFRTYYNQYLVNIGLTAFA